MSKINWLITDNNITVHYDGQTHIVPRTDALADKLISAMKEKRLDEIPNLVSAAKRVESFSKGNFLVKDGEVMVNGSPAPRVLSDKIVKFANEGLPYEPLLKFAERLQHNPSYRAVNELYQFLEKNDHPITENGHFIAYKKVKDDFKDVHSGTFDNSPGNIVQVPRNQVDEDCTRTCSNGLHAANFAYAMNFYGGGKMLEVEVDPADVVAIPTDYDQAKMRVSRYKVLGVVDKEVSTPLRVVDSTWRSNPNDLEDKEEYCDACDTHHNLSDFCDEEDEDDQDEDEYPWEDEV